MTNTLIQALHLNTRGIISLIGAGGKTSLMFRLAKDLAGSGRTVLTTTTTKIFMPEPDQSDFILIEDNAEELIKKSVSFLDRYPHFSAGSRHDIKSGKLIGLSPDVIDDLWQADLFDWIIVEADGSRQKPVKATNSHEPVLPETTKYLILVAGLDAVGTCLDDEHVHRAQIFSRNTGHDPGKILQEETIAAAIGIETKKAQTLVHAHFTTVFLNKADTQARISSGQKINHFLKIHQNIDQVIIGSLQSRSPVKT